MSKKVKFLLAVAAIVYTLFLIVVRFPAEWVAHSVHKAVPNLWLTSVSGTAWQGVAQGAQVDIGDKSIPMGAVNWRIHPMSLLTLSPCVSFDSLFSGRPFSGQVCRQLDGKLIISDFEISAPLDLANELTAPMKLAGQASLNIIQATINGTEVHALDGRLVVEGVKVDPNNGWLTLGTYAATLSQSENLGVAGTVMEIDAPFTVAMNLSWYYGAEMVNAEGTIGVTADSPPDVESALQIFGEEREQGVYYVKWP